MTGARACRAATFVLFSLAVACAPRARPFTGTPVPAVLPGGSLPAGHHWIVFRWSLEDPDFIARGEGAARLAYPDSARVDFFLGGGITGGSAVLIGRDVRLPSRSEDLSRRLLPPVPLLWSVLGRVAVPPHRDTAARVDADTLRAEIGTPVAWRLTFVRDTLRRMERVERGRVVEWVARSSDGRVRYRNEGRRRQLELTITRFDYATGFDASIWTLP